MKIENKEEEEKRKKISCGAIHTLIIGNWRNNHSVWAFGWNGKGQLGLNEEEHNKSLPIKIPTNFPPLRSIAGGGDQSIFITEEGEVYVTGCNENGQLGVPNQNHDLFLPILLPFSGERIKFAACGSSHSLFLTEEGKVFSCGDNQFGQLGLGDLVDRQTPSLIPLSDNLIFQSISCGRHHSLMIDVHWRVWSFGSNEFGQLGLAEQSPNRNAPDLLRDLPPIVDIACGCYHSVVVDVEGNLWTFGGNFEGQLGLGDFELRNFPMKISPQFAKIRKVRCGSVHSIALDEFGRVWAFGNNHLGQLGLNSPNHRINSPLAIDQSAIPKVVEFECGAYHSVFLDEFGSFWSTGRNVGGQLGLNDVEDRFSPSKIEYMSWASQYSSYVSFST